MPWKLYGKPGTDRAAGRCNGSSMQFHDLFCNGKPQSGAAGPALSGIVYPIEFFKNKIQLLRGDLIALVGKGDDDILLLSKSTDINVRSRITVSDGISQKIVKNPGQLVRICIHQKVVIRVDGAGQ